MTFLLPLLLSCLCLSVLVSRLKAVKLTRLKPIRIIGKLLRDSSPDVPSIFLGREKLEVLDAENGVEEGQSRVVTVCDVLPVPIVGNDLAYKYIMSLFSRKDSEVTRAEKSASACISAAKVFIGRDKGIFDNLPFVWKREGIDSRKQLYSFLSGGEGVYCLLYAIPHRRAQHNTTLTHNTHPNLSVICFCCTRNIFLCASVQKGTGFDAGKYTLNRFSFDELQNAEAIFPYALKKFLDCSIVGLIIEVKDELGKNSVSLGAAVVLARRGYESDYRISSKEMRLPEYTDELDSAVACVVNCHMEELILLSLATSMPIYM